MENIKWDVNTNGLDEVMNSVFGNIDNEISQIKKMMEESDKRREGIKNEIYGIK